MAKFNTGIISQFKEYRENEKNLKQWENKHKLFRRMKAGYDQTGLPGPPKNVRLTVTGDSSLSLRFDPPDEDGEGAVTRYKVEWSRAENFKPLVSEYFVHDLQNLQYDITSLECGVPYYVRVTAWNVKGCGKGTLSEPRYAIPSSWRNVENIQARSSNYNIHKLLDIVSNIKKTRPSPDMAETANAQKESPPNQRKTSTGVPLMKSLKGLFSSSFKFQKNLKRGIYLALVCYNEDRILVTTEENLPIVEVDETCNSNTLQADFDWLTKVLASSLDTVRQLKQDLEKCCELSSVHLKHQLISAVLAVQDVLGIPDLGKLFYKPINDGNGSTVLAVIHHIKDSKQLSQISSSLKWQLQNKLLKNSSSETIVPYLNEIIYFHQKCTNYLERGLYLGYLHVKINVDAIRVLVPETYPCVLPYIKIRDCPNVTKQEWQSILHLKDQHQEKDSHEILTFKKQLIKSSQKLFDKLGISVEQREDHRIYDVEVLDFSKDVSFILLIPSRDLVCSIHSQNAPNNSECVGMNSKKENMEIPVKAYEMIHLQAYHSHFVQTFSKAACLVDTQMILAQQMHRQAFLNEEVEKTKKQVEIIKVYQVQLEDMWRSSRWLTDAITYARDKTSQGVCLTNLYNSIIKESKSHDNLGKNSDDGYHSDKISIGGSTSSERLPLTGSINTNNNNGQYFDGERGCHQHPAVDQAKKQLDPGILRVYSSYNCGLAKGTSVMLHVTPKTTAREVVNLVIMQLNQAVINKGLSEPTYIDEQLNDFCLAAVIGPRERVLRDDYRLLELQNPWKKGRLCVRNRSDLLAALQGGETTDV